jgi:hypothetical protein
MSHATAKKMPLTFEWCIHSQHGQFSGEQKAELVDRMEQIAEKLSRGTAKIEFSYDVGSVIAKISAKTNASMIQRAKARAEADLTRGLQGFITKILILWNARGARKELEAKLAERLTSDYLKEEQAKATAELLLAFNAIITHANTIQPTVTMPPNELTKS